MKKMVIATTNANKVDRIKKLLIDEDYKILSLNEVINNDIKEPDEVSDNALGNAIIKANYYSEYVPDGYIVLSQDDTIELVGVRESDDPKGHIKAPVKAKYGEFNDELAAKYYSELAKKYGGSILMNFKYGHSIAVKNTTLKTFKKIFGATSTLKSRLVSDIYQLEKRPGYFLAALMEVKINGKWVKYNDLSDEELVKLDYDLYDSIKIMLDEMGD